MLHSASAKALPRPVDVSCPRILPEFLPMPPFRFLRKSLTLCAALLSLAGLCGSAQAAGRQTYMIPDNDGYGIAECFTDGRDCARVVADAWCEAHGNGAVIAYGRAEDTTASIAAATKSDAAMAAPPAAFIPGTIIISCAE